MGKIVFWIFLFCAIPTMIWGCFKIGGWLFNGLGIHISISGIIFIVVVIVGAVKKLLG